MPLAPAQFTQPVGDFAPHLFPVTDAESYASEEDKLAALLTAWIAQAEAAHPADEATQVLYVVWTARKAIYSAMAQSPLTASADAEGSYGYDYRQVADAKAERDAARLAYEAATSGPAPSLRRGSVVLSREVRW